MNRRQARLRRPVGFGTRLDRRTAALGAVAPLVLVLVVFALQARSAKGSLEGAAEEAGLLQAALVDGDAPGAQLTLERLQAETEDARGTTDSILWRLGSGIPLVGSDIRAVRTIATELDRVADDAIPPIVDVAGDVDASTFSPVGGTVRVASIAEVGPAVSQARAALERSQRVLADIDTAGLLAPLRGPVSSVTSEIASATAAATNADLAARLLPGILGTDETRRYLLLNQNNAEIRPTGGIVGSYAVVEIRKGRLRLSDQGSIQDLPTLDTPVEKLTDDELSVFPTTLGTDLRDVNITPDFPRTASLASALVRKGLGITVDGVVSIDPVALGYLLAGTGPIEVGDTVVLTQDDAVSTLVNRAYLQISDPARQDEFFAEATRAIFDRFASGAGDPGAILTALVKAVDDNRLTFWSADPAEQELIAPTALSGAYVTDDGTTPHVGVYLSDAASTKMEYYLDFATVPTAVRCLDGGRQVITTTTTLTSTAPTGVDLPESVTGDGRFVDRGDMRLNVRLFSPFKGRFTAVEVDGTPVQVLSGRLGDRNVTAVGVLLRPGRTVTVRASSTSGPGQTGDPEFTTTPGLRPQRNDYSIASACSR